MNNRLAIAVVMIASLGIWLVNGAEKNDSTSQTSVESTTIQTDTNKIYKLCPNDLVEINVYLEPDLAAKGAIDENGNINLPLLGAVKIGGKTPAEAAAYIKQLYEQDYLVQASVNVTVTEFAKRQFTVLGQVQKPGVFDYPTMKTITILEAIGLAGSFTRLGDQSNVSVQRRENGNIKIYKVDVKKMLNNPKGQQFFIYPDDVITVGETTF